MPRESTPSWRYARTPDCLYRRVRPVHDSWTPRSALPEYTVELTPDDRLQSAFRRGLALPKNFDASSARADNTRTWDSVGHLQLVVAIEDEFGIRLEPADVVELKSYLDAEAILKRRGRWTDG